MNPDIAGAKLGKELSSINLFYVYKAVNVVQEKELFSIHESTHPDFPLGRNIQITIEPLVRYSMSSLQE
ncbi:hypothetical protein AB1K81_16165 [Ornithinibacillus sp. 179-J 7C1 HS]